MTTAIHSPGPWKLCYDGEIESADGCTVVSLSFDSYREFSESAEVVKANYRLIAAAPDLLADNAALREQLERRTDAANGAINAALMMPDPVRPQLVAALKLASSALRCTDNPLVCKHAFIHVCAALTAAGVTP